MQLGKIILVSILFLTFGLTKVHADGNISLRGAYYKEKSTRVVQPMLDADLEVGESGALQLHGLVDAITSASASSGSNNTAFTEKRSEAGAHYLHQWKDLRFGGGARYSNEPDYQSIFLNLTFESNFAKKNTTLALGLVYGQDSIDNSGSQGGLSSIITKELDTKMVSISLGQLLSPTSKISFSYDLSFLDGFQANMYRRVAAGGMLQPERLPQTRMRHALATNLRTYISPIHTALIASYRFYADDWGILSHSPEMRAIVDLFDDNASLHFHYRYYRQGSSDFYKDVYDTADIRVEPFLSNDDKLGKVQTHLLGFKLQTKLALFGVRGSWSELELEALVQHLRQDTHYGNAFISQLALTIPIHY